MAAKESAGFQEFPQASFAVPSVEQMEERVALVVNSQDGLQSLGQSAEDPYPRAVKYIERHRIVEVFQVTMETLQPLGSSVARGALVGFLASSTLPLQNMCISNFIVCKWGGQGI